MKKNFDTDVSFLYFPPPCGFPDPAQALGKAVEKSDSALCLLGVSPRGFSGLQTWSAPIESCGQLLLSVALRFHRPFLDRRTSRQYLCFPFEPTSFVKTSWAFSEDF
jgi:hypothetical protein